jgi:hypothetical protein
VARGNYIGRNFDPDYKSRGRSRGLDTARYITSERYCYLNDSIKQVFEGGRDFNRIGDVLNAVGDFSKDNADEYGNPPIDVVGEAVGYLRGIYDEQYENPAYNVHANTFVPDPGQNNAQAAP